MALVKRESFSRYRGSLLGILWSLVNPIFLLLIYTFVFGVVFKSRWNGVGDSKIEFALILYSGLMVFSLFSDSINKAPGLIPSNINYVKKVIFPLEIIPVVSFGVCMISFLISFLIWLVSYCIFIGLPPITIFFFPLVMLPMVLFTMGITWILSSLGVYLRDISQFIVMVTSVLFFLSPIFYPISSVPEKYQIYLKINPLTEVIEMVRSVLIFGVLPNFYNLLIMTVASFFVAFAGFFWFQKTRSGFADVL